MDRRPHSAGRDRGRHRSRRRQGARRSGCARRSPQRLARLTRRASAMTGHGFPLSHPRLPSIVELQLQGAWDAALTELSLLRREGLVLLVEVNRAICLFRTDAFQDVACLAPGLSRLYPSTLSESDVTKLMMLLVSMGMVAHHRCYASTETRRFATELSRFPFAVADLCRM